MALELSPESGEYQEIEDARRIEDKKINGVYDYLGDVLVALYAYKQALHLRIRDQVIPILPDLSARLIRDPDREALSIFVMIVKWHR
jgi:hypothetical protein